MYNYIVIECIRNLMGKRESYNAIDRQELIASSQTAVLIGNAARNYSWYVDGRVLLFAAHDIEAEAFGRFGQLDDARMRMTFGCRERSYCGLF